jgi:hypothetical protein
MSADPSYLRPGQRVIAYPRFLDKLSTVLKTGNVGLDPTDSRWHTYEQILTEIQTWPSNCRPIIISEVDPTIGRMPGLAMHVEEWMEDAKRIAFGNHKQVLENGSELSSDSDSEGDGQDDSKAMGGISERRRQIVSYYVAWYEHRKCAKRKQATPRISPPKIRNQSPRGWQLKLFPKKDLSIYSRS